MKRNEYLLTRHLGAVIDSTSYHEKYVLDNVENVCKKLSLLSEIARVEPHAAYACFTTVLKLTFLVRTIPDVSTFMKKIDIGYSMFSKANILTSLSQMSSCATTTSEISQLGY